MKPGPLFASLLALLTLSLGDALLCYRYEATYANNQTKAQCSPVRMLCQGDDTCAAYTLTAWNKDTILARGCLERFRCGNVTSKAVHEDTYDCQVATCCDTDLCNAASGARVSILSALSLLLLWLVH
ncbi:prostate stem cell antigen-like [Ambystoma mexicanum]|uniref:prostate stem cell antigen-like n=1 Tax=Ambystoma mexicanum TaxID=8296 RepID=UPI0037E77FA9